MFLADLLQLRPAAEELVLQAGSVITLQTKATLICKASSCWMGSVVGQLQAKNMCSGWTNMTSQCGQRIEGKLYALP